MYRDKASKHSRQNMATRRLVKDVYDAIGRLTPMMDGACAVAAIKLAYEMERHFDGRSLDSFHELLHDAPEKTHDWLDFVVEPGVPRAPKPKW